MRHARCVELCPEEEGWCCTEIGLVSSRLLLSRIPNSFRFAKSLGLLQVDAVTPAFHDGCCMAGSFGQKRSPRRYLTVGTPAEWLAAQQPRENGRLQLLVPHHRDSVAAGTAVSSISPSALRELRKWVVRLAVSLDHNRHRSPIGQPRRNTCMQGPHLNFFELTSRQRVGKRSVPFLSMMTSVAPSNIGGRHGFRRETIQELGIWDTPGLNTSSRSLDSVITTSPSLSSHTLLVQACMLWQIPSSQ